jgi:EmrB/QacA subfamily drug resistance transporter
VYVRKWLPLLAVSLGTFMLLVDVTIVNVALPAISSDLDASFTQLQWVVDIYALALAAVLLGLGSLADLLGRRRVYVLGLGVFALASAVCGLAPEPNTLIIARAVQGLGAAAMLATTIALLNISYRGRDLGTAFGIWGAVSGASAAVGPIVGGLLTEHLSWRWVFFVNLPVSLAAIVLTLKVFSEPRNANRVKIDFAGIAVFTVAAGSITFALVRATDEGWLSLQTLGFLGLGVVALVAFVLIERRSVAPMFDLGLLRSSVFSGVLIAGVLLPACAFGALAVASIWLQSVTGLSPIQAGLALIPLSICAFGLSASIGRFLHGPNGRWVIPAGLFLIGVGALLQSFQHPDSTWRSLAVGLAVVGVGVGLATPTMASVAMSAVPRERSGMAAGAINTGRQLGFAFGIAVLGGVFQKRVVSDLRDGGLFPDPGAAGRALSSGAGPRILAAAPADKRAALDGAVHAAFASGMHLAFIVAAVMGIAGSAVVALLMRTAKPAAVADPSAAAQSVLEVP